MLRQPLEVALRRKYGAGLAPCDAVEQFGGTRPFRRDTLAFLRMGNPAPWRRLHEEEQGVELPRLLERWHPAGEGNGRIEVETQATGVEQLGKVFAGMERRLDLQASGRIDPSLQPCRDSGLLDGLADRGNLCRFLCAAQ